MRAKKTQEWRGGDWVQAEESSLTHNSCSICNEYDAEEGCEQVWEKEVTLPILDS